MLFRFLHPVIGGVLSPPPFLMPCWPLFSFLGEISSMHFLKDRRPKPIDWETKQNFDMFGFLQLFYLSLEPCPCNDSLLIFGERDNYLKVTFLNQKLFCFVKLYKKFGIKCLLKNCKVEMFRSLILPELPSGC